jgi:hypothetical protein
MKTTFKGQKVFMQNPTPKVNDVWLDDFGFKQKVIEVIKFQRMANAVIFEDENGEKSKVGMKWVGDSDYYTYLGRLS